MGPSDIIPYQVAIISLTEDYLTEDGPAELNSAMLSQEIIDALSPHIRLVSAIAPFAGALLVRFIVGNNRLTGVLLSIGTTWFAVNVLMAPYSIGMRTDLLRIRALFP
jgi:hypothetical protein